MEKNDNLNTLFADLDGQWDIYEPSKGHAERFLDKQSKKKSKPLYAIPLAVAASLLLAFGLFTFYDKSDRPQQLAEMSKQTRETDSVFTSIIKYEMARIKEKESPVNKQMVQDALVELQKMDTDYEKIKSDLAKGGETQQLIHALVANLKTQISFLENVLNQIEKNEQLKISTDEKVL